MRIVINGDIREVSENITLAELIKSLHLTPERVAVELNRRVIRRSEWAETTFGEDDRIEIVHFVGGGSSPFSSV
ncbi:MAG: thiamine biosynthesis protein ThiS [Acidobacteria bacterium 13_1_20CM_3_53_8]|nr:MAG: thiamine biosynthesis protein ThiS [Acidobacteria bacterium 13_1_20CM_3_53_8]